MRRKTLQDVARAAGVSAATVSRAVNRSARVSLDVEKRIQQTAERLGVDLRRRKSNREIAFVLSNRSPLHPVYSHVLIAAEEYCAEHGYDLLFLTLRYQSNVPCEQVHLPRVLERPDIVDGAIVCGLNGENLLQVLSHRGLPFSVFGDTVQGEWKAAQYDVVWTDDITGAYEMTRYLCSHGNQHIWYVANTRFSWFARRLEGYLLAMKEFGLEPHVSSIDSNNDQEVGLLGAKSMLRSREPVQAIFCGNDTICHGVYEALRDVGMRVPADISVAGFNDTSEAVLLHPPLTTVRVFIDHIGRLLAELILNRIENPGLDPQSRILPTQIVKRESCRPPTNPGDITIPRVGIPSGDLRADVDVQAMGDGARVAGSERASAGPAEPPDHTERL